MSILGIEEHPGLFECREETDCSTYTIQGVKFLRELRLFVDLGAPDVHYPAFGSIPDNPRISIVLINQTQSPSSEVSLLFTGVREFGFGFYEPLEHAIMQLPLLQIVDLSKRQTSPTPWLVLDPENRRFEFRAISVRIVPIRQLLT